MKLFLALQILLSASSYGPFVSVSDIACNFILLFNKQIIFMDHVPQAAKSIEEAVGSGCENHIELSSTFSADSGEECNSCKLCDGYSMNEIFMPKGQGICVKCVSVDSSCKMFNVITSFSSPWSMKFLPYTATSMSSEYDPKAVFIYGSNDSVTWTELFKSDNTDILLKERSGTVEFIIGDNDQDYNFYKVTFALKDGVTKMHLGHLGVVPALTKTCTADIHSAITGEDVKLFDTLAPTQVPSDTPSNAPSDTQGYEFNSKQELESAVDLYVTNEKSASSQYGVINDWDVSRITDMENMFREARAFNSNISDWNTSSVSSMFRMFSEAEAFNSNISDWNTSSVTSMFMMFYTANAFNSNISDWNTSKVTRMNYMFYNAEAFDQVLCWDVSKANQGDMFTNAHEGAGLSPNYPEC